MNKRSLLGLLLLWLPLSSSADTFSQNTHYRVCFTPQENCTATIVDAIHQAKQTIRVQAYSFTSRPIEHALIAAQRKGVQVKIIFDKSQRNPHYSSPFYLARAGIPLFIDDSPAIAHNKVIIIDHRIVVTGSFNFTRAAQKSNAENVLIIEDPRLAQRYIQNWEHRAALSLAYSPGKPPPSSRMLSRTDSDRLRHYVQQLFKSLL